MNKNQFHENYNLEIMNIKRTAKNYIYKAIIDFLRQLQIFSYSKVVTNITLTFIFPIVLFSIPISNNINESFLENFSQKIHSGMLFSTSISILSTIISSYVDSASTQKNQQKENARTKQIKDLSHVLPIILIAFLLTFLGAFYYGQLNGNIVLNKTGITIQIILYIIVQIIHGIADSKMKNSTTYDLPFETEKLQEEVEDKTDVLSLQTNSEVVDNLGGKKL